MKAKVGLGKYCSEEWEKQLLCSNQFRDDKDLSSVIGRTFKRDTGKQKFREGDKVVSRSQEIHLSLR